MPVFKFRNCLLNTVERSVIKDREYVEFTTRTFDVLQYLIENAGKIVSKDEILGNVWNGSFVEESNLPVHISKLRRALGETRDTRFIETVQGVGYRFVTPVEVVDEKIWQNRLYVAKQVSSNYSHLFCDSIAVLPLEDQCENLGLDYIADGLTESFINKLALIPDLKVIARNTVFRYKNKEADAKDVGELLGVGTVLTGRIRGTVNRLTVSAELVRVSDGTQVWGDQFKCSIDELVGLTTTIATLVARNLRPIAHESSETRVGRHGAEAGAPHLFPGTRNSTSYKNFLKGEYFLAKRTVESAIHAFRYFTDAFSSDQNNPHAYARAIECIRYLYILDHISYDVALEQIRPLLYTLLRLDQEIDSVQLTLAEVNLHLAWNVTRGAKHLENALSLNPNCIDARHRYAELLKNTGRVSEAVVEIDRYLEIDPVSLLGYKRVGRLFYGLGDYEKALAFLGDALELEPRDFEALALMGAVHTELAEYDSAMEFFDQSLNSLHTVEVLSMLGYVEALRGRKRASKKYLHEIEAQIRSGKEYPAKRARIYFALGEKDLGYRLLDRALESREIELTMFASDPRWNLVRDEQRFIDLVRRIIQQGSAELI